jgi:hypothetical protein
MNLRDQRAVLRQLAEITLHPRNRKHNVPITRQVSMFLRTTRGAKRRLLPALAEHPDARQAMKEGRSLWAVEPFAATASLNVGEDNRAASRSSKVHTTDSRKRRKIGERKEAV